MRHHSYWTFALIISQFIKLRHDRFSSGALFAFSEFIDNYWLHSLLFLPQDVLKQAKKRVAILKQAKKRVAIISAKNHKRQSVTAKREKSQTPKVLTAILT